jgi:hypothetical protein
MKLGKIFLGKPVHWLPWLILAPLMKWMDATHFHILYFNFFALALLGIAAAVLALFLLSSHSGEQLTRDPFPDGRDVAGTGSED